MITEKKNNGNQMQAMVPKGNGRESGQFTDDTDDRYFKREFHCTKTELNEKYTNSQITSIIKYTDYEFGIQLNKKIRTNSYNDIEAQILDCIISSIESFELPKSLKIYRGLHLESDLYDSIYLSKYNKGEPIIDQEIFSASREKQRAFLGTENIKHDVRIVIELELPKKYHALPIEDISLDSKEKEVLLHRPMFMITSIDDERKDDDIIKVIKGVVL